MKKPYYLSLIFILFTISCLPSMRNERTKQGWKPIYKTEIVSSKIESREPVPVSKAGKIVAKGQLIFQNEIMKGIHVIDISDPSQPRRISFIAIDGCTDFTLKENILLANRYANLESIDITYIYKVKHLITKESIIDINQSRPPVSNVAYECPNLSKGQVVDWVWDENSWKECF